MIYFFLFSISLFVAEIPSNINWEQSAGTNENDSEWGVNEQNYFENIFMHSCYPLSI